MTVLLITGAETGSLKECNNSWVDANTLIQSTVKRTGGYSYKVGSLDNGFRFIGRNTSTGVWAGFNKATLKTRAYFYISAVPASGHFTLMIFKDSGLALKGFISITSARKLQAYDADGNQLGSDGATVLSLNTWYRINVSWGTGASEAYSVKIDGATELSGTGNLGTNNHNYFDISSDESTAGDTTGGTYYVDDIVVDDADEPGAGQIEIMQPTGDGAYTTWTASTGDKWDCVDEIPISNTDYVESTLTSGNAYTAALESAASAGISGTINAVEQILDVKRAGAANGTIRMRLRSNTTDSDTGTNYGTTATEVTLGRIFATDPATSSAWTTSGLDGVEVGAIERETTDKSRLYGAYLMVDFTPTVAAATRHMLGLLGVGK